MKKNENKEVQYAYHRNEEGVKETYAEPGMEILRFEAQDIITSSPNPIGGFPDAP